MGKIKDYDWVLGWQQFYAINLAFFARLFGLNKRSRIVVLNFTYKRKGGVIGGLYYRYMRYAVNNKYIDYLHVPSYGYAERCCEELGLRKEQFIITHFGVADSYDELKDLKVEKEDFVLSIGRSNRDFEFLVKVWKQKEMEHVPLVIISDEWQPQEPLPTNIEWFSNVIGAASKPWMNACRMMVIPISDGNICSGDTVLLTGMMLRKPVIVTSPSTLAEMYIEDGVDGLAVAKDVDLFTQKVLSLYNDTRRREVMGDKARATYLERFSSNAMGKAIGKALCSAEADSTDYRLQFKIRDKR